jgi:hypothetical protein
LITRLRNPAEFVLPAAIIGTSLSVGGCADSPSVGVRPGDGAGRASGPTVLLVALFLALTLLSTMVLYVLATQTDRYFAWTIRPPLSAALLGGGDAAGFVLVVLTMRQRELAKTRIAGVWHSASPQVLRCGKRRRPPARRGRDPTRGTPSPPA